jgi:hypothetical protein
MMGRGGFDGGRPERRMRRGPPMHEMGGHDDDGPSEE